MTLWKLEKIQNMFSILSKHYFFIIIYIKYFSLLQKGKAENANKDVSQFQETQVERAKRIMKPFVLRRLKKDVLNNLPKKESFIVSSNK